MSALANNYIQKTFFHHGLLNNDRGFFNSNVVFGKGNQNSLNISNVVISTSIIVDIFILLSSNGVFRTKIG